MDYCEAVGNSFAALALQASLVRRPTPLSFMKSEEPLPPPRTAVKGSPRPPAVRNGKKLEYSAEDPKGAGAGGGGTGNASASGTSAGADGEEGVGKDGSEARMIGDQIVDLLAKARDSGRPVKKEHFRALCDFVQQQKTSDPVEGATELMNRVGLTPPERDE